MRQPTQSLRPVFTTEERARWVSRFRSSGLKQAQFAQQNGLRLGTLQRWLYGRWSGAAPKRIESGGYTDQASRADKQARVERLVEEQNGSLAAHRRAKVLTAARGVEAKLQQLKINAWLGVKAEGRTLKLTVNRAALAEASRFDGCDVLKTDLPPSAASQQVVHDRSKDLAPVEQAFRTCKTAHLETRPVWVRTAEHTRGHVLIVMLAYLMRRELSRAWAALDTTVEEGLHQLQTLCATELRAEGGASSLRIPTPGPAARALLNAVHVHLPEALPHHDTRVVTRKKLPERQKPR